MKKGTILIIVSGIAVCIIALVIIFMKDGGLGTPNDSSNPVFMAGDPIDPTVEFYDSWLEAVKSTTTNPIENNLLSDKFLSEAVREYVKTAQEDVTRTVDPVLCQTIIPERIGAKVSYANNTQAQLLIFARGGEEKSSEIAVVDLTVVNNEWQISKIGCSDGETAPEREFSFEHDGFLLRSVPPPLNPDFWYLVFEENGQKGHTSPLFLNSESMCVAIDGTETTCDETQFSDATKVHVQGEMTEAGVEVKNITFLVK